MSVHDMPMQVHDFKSRPHCIHMSKIGMSTRECECIRLHDVPLRFSRTAHVYLWEVGIPTSSASPRGHWGGRKSAAGTQQVLPLFLVYIAGCLDQVYK